MCAEAAAVKLGISRKDKACVWCRKSSCSQKQSRNWRSDKRFLISLRRSDVILPCPADMRPDHPTAEMLHAGQLFRRPPSNFSNFEIGSGCNVESRTHSATQHVEAGVCIFIPERVSIHLRKSNFIPANPRMLAQSAPWISGRRSFTRIPRQRSSLPARNLPKSSNSR
jgi:hypothetical protein